MNSRVTLFVLVFSLGGLQCVLGLGNAEIAYYLNGKAYSALDGTLTEESTGKPLPTVATGIRPRWYQGGTGALRPLLHLAAFQYQREAKVQEDYWFEPMSGSQASRALLNGQLDWAVLGRDLLAWEKDAGLRAETVAWDALFVVVPADLPVESVSLRKLAAIYVGQVTNWSQVGGPDLAIVPFAYSERSGTAGAFRDLVLERIYGDDGRLSKRAILLDYDSEVFDRVGVQPGAIGFGPRSLDGVEPNSPVKMLKVDTIGPEADEIASGRYPISRPLNFVTIGEPESRARVILDALLGERLQAAASGLKLLPAR